MLNFFKKNYYKLFLFIAIAYWGLFRAFDSIQPYPTGDGPEYVLTTEALYNHLSPDIQASDAESFKKAFSKANDWTENFKYPDFDDTEAWLKIPNKEFMSMHGGIYVAENKKCYGYHFSFYSLVNVPARMIAGIVNGNPLRCFQITNAVLILLVSLYFLFFAGLNNWSSTLLSLSFFFSASFWYTGWTHPEVLTSCLVALGTYFFLNSRFKLSILFVSLAATQNQPLLILLGFILLKAAIDNFNLKSIIVSGVFALPAILPSLFYLLHFGTTNLIKDAGFLSTEYIHFTRVFGFFWDINQGMVLAIPLVLIFYFGILITKALRQIFKKEPFEYNLLLPLIIIIMSCIVSTMGNWNHGQAIINRYASWFSSIVLVQTFYWVSKNNSLQTIVLQNYFFVTQLFTTLYHEQFNKFDWDMSNHKPLAKYFLDHHPSFYNPDPIIFIYRTVHANNTEAIYSPIIYFSDKKNPDSHTFQATKLAVHKDKVNELVKYGYAYDDIQRIKPKLKFINNWAYINKGDIQSRMSAKEIYLLGREIKLKQKAEQIIANRVWVEDIKKKAIEWNKTFEEVLRIDAEYLLSEEEKAE